MSEINENIFNIEIICYLRKSYPAFKLVFIVDPHDRDTWRSGVRSAMRAASQLPGRGPTVVDMAPIPAR